MAGRGVKPDAPDPGRCQDAPMPVSKDEITLYYTTAADMRTRADDPKVAPETAARLMHIALQYERLAALIEEFNLSLGSE